MIPYLRLFVLQTLLDSLRTWAGMTDTLPGREIPNLPEYLRITVGFHESDIRWCVLHDFTSRTGSDYLSPSSATNFRNICPRQPFLSIEIHHAGHR